MNRGDIVRAYVRGFKDGTHGVCKPHANAHYREGLHAGHTWGHVSTVRLSELVAQYVRFVQA